MSRPAYEMFCLNELDPVACLATLGIDESNKYDVLKLAGVLASFKDFKDKKYRLKITKDQTVMIQAVRFLLERSAVEVKVGKRCLEGTADDLSGVKRIKACKLPRGAACKSGSEAPLSLISKCTGARDHPRDISIPVDEIEAALTLQSMARKCTAEDQIIFKGAHECGSGAGYSVDSMPTGRLIYPCEDHRRQLEHAPNWYLDTAMHGTRLKDMLVIVKEKEHLLGDLHVKYGAYKGSYACVISVSNSGGQALAVIKLLQGRSLSTSTDGTKVKIPARILSPLLPERCGDNVILLRDEQGLNVKGMRGKVVGFGQGKQHDDHFTDDEENGYGDKLLEVESDAFGYLILPQTHLAKCRPVK